MKDLFYIFYFIFFLSSCSQPQKKEVPLKEFSQVASSIIEPSAKREIPEIDSSPVIDSSKIQEAISFCKKQKLDSTLAFFADMSIHSGKKRFFAFDLRKKKILHLGLVCHGIGKGSTSTEPVFSNEKGSNCSSLGKYKTGIRSYSNWVSMCIIKCMVLKRPTAMPYNGLWFSIPTILYLKKKSIRIICRWDGVRAVRLFPTSL